MPRKPEGDRPLTQAERQARQRQRRKDREIEMVAAFGRILAAHTIGEAQRIAAEAREIAASTMEARP